MPSGNLYIFVAGAETLFTGKTLALGAFLRAVGLLFIGSRDIMPLWASIVFGNSFLITGDLCFNFGIVEALNGNPLACWSGICRRNCSFNLLVLFRNSKSNYARRPNRTCRS